MLISKRKRRFLTFLTYAVLLLFSCYSLFPFLWMVVTSIKPDDQIRTLNPTFLIKDVTLKHYDNVLNHSSFLIYMKNSLIIASIATLLSLLISVFSGYALSRYTRFKGVQMFSVAMLLSQMIPGVLLLIPLYLIMKSLALINTHLSLVLAYTTFTIPLCIFMMKSFFDSVPYEMEESAEIDGAGPVQKFFTITLPLLKPIMIYTVTVAIFEGYRMFGESYVFWNESMPGDIGLTIVRYIYQQAFQRNDLGFGSAIGITLLVIVLAINLAQLKFFGFFKKDSDS